MEPRLAGVCWRRGFVFPAVPWLGGLVVVLPIICADVLGLGISAGPLPALGTLVASLLYGLGLGALYDREDVLTETGEADDGRERRRCSGRRR